jgi:hypothetical protein
LTGTGDYLAAVAELGLIAAAAGFGAWRLRAALLPTWTGSPARLAELVLGLGLVMVPALFLGAVHAFEEAWFVGGCVVAGIVAALVAVAIPRPRSPVTPPVIASAPGMVWVAAVVAFLLVLNWAIGAEESLHGGMYGFDTMWYHGPFAAGFAQDGSTTAIHFTGAYGPLVWFYPQNSELLHAGGILLFGNDFLSPLLNLGWLSLGLFAAWCLGRPAGVPALTMTGAAVVLGSTPWLVSQPGNAYNDVAALALLLGAIALLVNGGVLSEEDQDWRPVLVAGVAAGLAVGTKLTVVAPVGAVAIGLIALAPGGRRLATSLAFLAPLAVLGSFWYLRNLFLVGNPLPSLDLGVLPSPELPPHHSDFSVAHYLTDGGVWSDWFLPGLHDAMGVVWPVILVGAGAGAVLALVRGQSRMVRLLGAVTLLAAIAYVVTPYGAQGPEGSPRNFEDNLRYAAPALILGLSLLALVVPSSKWWRWALLGGLGVLFVMGDTPLDARHGPYLKLALAIALVLVAGPLALALWPGRRRVVTVGALGLVAAVAVVAGHEAERTYIDGRYAKASSVERNRALDAAFAWAREVKGARIATDVFRQYGLYGNELSNRVTFLGVERAHGSFMSIPGCAAWRRAINAGNFDFVVPAPTYRDAAGGVHAAPALRWTASDPAVRRLPGAAPVFAVRGELSPEACPAS